jgi:hypothetical protein
MSSKAKNKAKKDPILETETYIEFLKKRLKSENYKNNVSEEEYKKETAKYEKAKLKLKFLKQDCK